MHPENNPLPPFSTGFNPAFAAGLCQSTYKEGSDVVKALEKLGLPIATSFPCLNKHPLFFVHIPKTAGASLHQFLDTQFDESDIFPGWNPPDLSFQRRTNLPYLLFRGHFTAGQRGHAPSGTELFTVLRRPVSHAYSFFSWLRRLDRSYWKTADRAASQRNAKLKGRSGKFGRRMSNSAMRAAKQLSFKEFLQKDDFLSRLFFDNVATCHLSDLGLENSPATKHYVRLLSNGAPKSRFALGISASRNLNDCLVSGIFERLNLSLQVLCWKRGWAAPDTLPKIHSNSDREVFRPVDLSTRRLIQKNTRIDEKLYSAAMAQLEAQWNQLVSEAGEASQTADWLNRRHRERFFANATAVYAVDVSASKAWPGEGWGLRGRNEHGQFWRWIGTRGHASLLMKLVPGSAYLLTALIHTAADSVVFDSLKAEIQGFEIQFAGRDHLDGCLVLRWLIDQENVGRCAGNMEVVFRIDAGNHKNALALSRIICHPW